MIIENFGKVVSKKSMQMTALPEFDPDNVNAKNIEEVSLLGPLFRLSAYPDAAVSRLLRLYWTWTDSFLAQGRRIFLSKC